MRQILQSKLIDLYADTEVVDRLVLSSLADLFSPVSDFRRATAPMNEKAVDEWRCRSRCLKSQSSRQIIIMPGS